MTVDSPVPEHSRGAGWVQAIGLAALEFVPGGGAISTLISEPMRQAARARDEEWAAWVNARLARIESGDLPIDTTDPEFIAALRRLLVAATQTADDEKRRTLARAAANAGPWSTTDLANREEYVALLIDLTSLHIRGLSLVAEKQVIHGAADGGSPSIDFPSFARDLGTDQPTAQRVMIALQQRGLFGTPMGNFGTTIEITRFGAGLLAFLSEND